eukprot:SAG11_NODE_6090_length_1390_cov_1.560806_2_plen_70_part_01
MHTPQGSYSGKGIQLLAITDVPDLSLFGLGVANNGGATSVGAFPLSALHAICLSSHLCLCSLSLPCLSVP